MLSLVSKKRGYITIFYNSNSFFQHNFCSHVQSEKLPSIATTCPIFLLPTKQFVRFFRRQLKRYSAFGGKSPFGKLEAYVMLETPSYIHTLIPLNLFYFYHGVFLEDNQSGIRRLVVTRRVWKAGYVCHVGNT